MTCQVEHCQITATTTTTSEQKHAAYHHIPGIPSQIFMNDLAMLAMSVNTWISHCLWFRSNLKWQLLGKTLCSGLYLSTIDSFWIPNSSDSADLMIQFLPVPFIAFLSLIAPLQCRPLHSSAKSPSCTSLLIRTLTLTAKGSWSPAGQMG